MRKAVTVRLNKELQQKLDFLLEALKEDNPTDKAVLLAGLEIFYRIVHDNPSTLSRNSETSASPSSPGSPEGVG